MDNLSCNCCEPKPPKNQLIVEGWKWPSKTAIKNIIKYTIGLPVLIAVTCAFTAIWLLILLSVVLEGFVSGIYRFQLLNYYWQYVVSDWWQPIREDK